MLVSCSTPLYPTVSDRTWHSLTVYTDREVHSSGAGKQSVVLQGPAPCPSYRAGLEPPPPLTMGFHSVLPASPSVLSFRDLLELMALGLPQGWGACGRRRCWDSPDHCLDPGLFALGGVSRAGKCGESQGRGWWDGLILTGRDRVA